MPDNNPAPCGQCASTSTSRAYYPALLAWFCVGDDGTTCYSRKKAREATAPAVPRG